MEQVAAKRYYKTALFLIMSDTDSTFNFLISMIYTQLFNLLCEKADDVYGGRLPVHVRCLIDEAANIGQIPNLEKLVATIRSREISACLVLQAQSQLKALYKDNADTIIGNIAKMKSARENENLIKMAKYYDTAAENLFSFWGIPKSYLVFDKKEDLSELMENELIEPEEAGFYPCDSGCAGNCPCCEAEDDEADEDEDFSEMLETLSALIHDVFGDNVSVHIVLE